MNTTTREYLNDEIIFISEDYRERILLVSVNAHCEDIVIISCEGLDATGDYSVIHYRIEAQETRFHNELHVTLHAAIDAHFAASIERKSRVQFEQQLTARLQGVFNRSSN